MKLARSASQREEEVEDERAATLAHKLESAREEKRRAEEEWQVKKGELGEREKALGAGGCSRKLLSQFIVPPSVHLESGKKVSRDETACC